MGERITDEFKKKHFGRWGKFNIYLVDDEAVRNKAKYAEEFSDFAVNIHGSGLSTINFPFIPKNEIWIARSFDRTDRKFIVDIALAYIRNVERRLSSAKAYEKALAYEDSMRSKMTNRKLYHVNVFPFKNITHQNIFDAVYDRKYLCLMDGKETVCVYLVDGEVVRDLYKTDYVEGGHGYVYDWVPKDEVWIDRTLTAKEIPVIVLHELFERMCMKYDRFPYGKAHEMALKVEFEHRGNFTKEDLKKLSRRTMKEWMKRYK